MAMLSAEMAGPLIEQVPNSKPCMIPHGHAPYSLLTDCTDSSRPSSPCNGNANYSKGRRSFLVNSDFIHGLTSRYNIRQDMGLRPSIVRTYQNTVNNKKTDELLVTTRNSFFGGRRKRSVNEADIACLSNRAPPSRNGLADLASMFPGHANKLIKAEQEALLHQKKASISQPFNFEHITHTSPKQLRRLQTVPAKDLAAEFWALPDRKMSRKYGIRVDELRERIHRELGIPKLPPALLPTTKISSAPRRPMTSDVVFTRQRTATTKLNTRLAHQVSALETDSSVPREPSSMNLETAIPSRAQLTTDAEAMRQSLNRGESAKDVAQIRPQPLLHDTGLHVGQPLSTGNVGQLRTQPLFGDSFSDERQRLPAPVVVRPNRQPLMHDANSRIDHPLPAQLRPSIGRSISEKSVLAGHEQDDWESAYIKWYAKPELESENAPQSCPRRIRLSRLPAESRCTTPNPSSWEDAVDFAYEQCAESTCDLDWTNYTTWNRTEGSCNRPSRLNMTLATLAWDQHGTTHATVSRSDEASEEGQSPMSDHFRTDHRRGSSVGHRGFLAARMAGTTPTTSSPELVARPSTAASASPVLASADVDVDDVSPSTVSPHPPRVDSVSSNWIPIPNCRIPEAGLRDMTFDGTRMTSDDEMQQISSHATSSVSDMTHKLGNSRRESLSTLAESRASSATLSQAADRDFAYLVEESSTFEDYASGFVENPHHEPLIMRRPPTEGDRTALQAAGRAVQRGRPPTPQRFSRLLEQPHLQALRT